MFGIVCPSILCVVLILGLVVLKAGFPTSRGRIIKMCIDITALTLLEYAEG